MNKRGFTLTEVLIGMTILMTAVISSSVLVNNLQKTNEINMKLIQANALAVEGLELVRNMRDSNWLNNRDYLNGEIFGREIGEGQHNFELKDAPGLQVVINANQLSQASPVKITNGSGQFGENEEFKRYITFKELQDGTEVTAVVTFDIPAGKREVTLSTILTDWKNAK